MIHGYIALRPAKVAEKLGVKKSTLTALRKRPDFPKPVRITDRAIAFVESEVDAWIDSRRST